MKTLKLKKDIVEQLTSNQARNVKGGTEIEVPETNPISVCICLVTVHGCPQTNVFDCPTRAPQQLSKCVCIAEPKSINTNCIA